MVSSRITSWQIDGKTMETLTGFIFLDSNITADGNCSHEMKRCLLLGRKSMTNLDSILKCRDIILLMGFPGSSASKESTCNAGDPGLIPGPESSAREGIGYTLQYSWDSLVSQLVKNLPTIQETWVWIHSWEYPLEKVKYSPVFWLREFHGLYSPLGLKESNTTEQIQFSLFFPFILLTKVHIIKDMVFPVVMYGCESWTIKKAEHWRIEAFELWCWRTLDSPLNCWRSNQSIFKKSVLNVH